MAFQDLLDKVKNGLTDTNDADETNEYQEDSYFDSFDDEILEPDPQPSRLLEKPTSKKTPRAKKTPAAPVKVTAAKKREIKDFLVLMITMPAATVSMKDPHCGGAFVDNAEAIADALVPLICRNPAMLAWFTSGTGMFDYFVLLQALQPVATTIWQHHVTKSIDHNHNHGEDQYDDISQFRAPTFG